MYEELVKRMRDLEIVNNCEKCESCPWPEDFPPCASCIPSTFCEAANAIEKLATELATNSKNVATWLPASRPPEEPGQYLVFIRFPANDVENWEMFGLEAPVGMVSEAYFNKDQFLWETEHDAYNAMLDLVDAENDSAVTHWMKLPPMPEVET